MQGKKEASTDGRAFIKTSVTLHSDTYTALRNYAEASGATMSGLVDHAVNETYFKRAELSEPFDWFGIPNCLQAIFSNK